MGAITKIVDGSVYVSYYVGTTWQDEDAVGGGLEFRNADDATVALRCLCKIGG